MLVKLGTMWFRADRVESINISCPPKGLIQSANRTELQPLSNGPNNHWVSVCLIGSPGNTIHYCDKLQDAIDFADDCAAIVNKAVKD